MIKFYSPLNKVELSIIRSMLDFEEILYFVYNDHLCSTPTFVPVSFVFYSKCTKKGGDAMDSKLMFTLILLGIVVLFAIQDFSVV